MTDPVFHNPGPEVDPTRVRRHKGTGAPFVKWPCPDVDGCVDGRVPGARAGRDKQCPSCKGKGYVERLYSRCTSFVGVLEERSALESWRQRIVLTGLGVDHGLLKRLDEADPDDRAELNAIAEEAFQVGEGHERAQKGTDLHRLSEYVDNGWAFPEFLTGDDGIERPVTLQDRADMAAWKRTMADLDVTTVASEVFVVNDELAIGGTFDRVVAEPVRGGVPTAICRCRLPYILDLKTGRVDYGAGKIAQQLAVYSRSSNYDPATGERSPLAVCAHVGIVIHLPQGTGEATVLLADLEAGWEAVQLSARVRDYRKQSGFLSPLNA